MLIVCLMVSIFILWWGGGVSIGESWHMSALAFWYRFPSFVCRLRAIKIPHRYLNSGVCLICQLPVVSAQLTSVWHLDLHSLCPALGASASVGWHENLSQSGLLVVLGLNSHSNILSVLAWLMHLRLNRWLGQLYFSLAGHYCPLTAMCCCVSGLCDLDSV